MAVGNFLSNVWQAIVEWGQKAIGALQAAAEAVKNAVAKVIQLAAEVMKIGLLIAIETLFTGFSMISELFPEANVSINTNQIRISINSFEIILQFAIVYLVSQTLNIELPYVNLEIVARENNQFMMNLRVEQGILNSFDGTLNSDASSDLRFLSINPDQIGLANQFDLTTFENKFKNTIYETIVFTTISASDIVTGGGPYALFIGFFFSLYNIIMSDFYRRTDLSTNLGHGVALIFVAIAILSGLFGRETQHIFTIEAVATIVGAIAELSGWVGIEGFIGLEAIIGFVYAAKSQRGKYAWWIYIIPALLIGFCSIKNFRSNT